MKPNLLNPARVAAILVIVVVAASFVVEASRHPVGYRVFLMRYDPRGCENDDRRTIVVQVREYDTRLNQQTYRSTAEFNEAIKQILTTRAERVVFVAADSDVTYDSVVQHIDAMRAMFPDLRVALVTPSLGYDSCYWGFISRSLVPKPGERQTPHVPGEAPPFGFHEPRELATKH